MAKEVDTPAAEALTFILANKGQNMTIEHRRHWTRFLLSMHWRNPTALEAVTIEARKFITKNFNNNPEEYRAVRQPGDPPTLLEWQELNRPYDMDDAGRHMLKPLILDDRSGTDIMNMRWATIDLSASSISLLTCDRPFHNGRGIKHPDTVVSLPISPSKLFIATNTEKVEREIDRVGPTDVAVRRNRDTVALAVKHVYGNTDGHLRFVENRLRQTRSSPKNA